MFEGTSWDVLAVAYLWAGPRLGVQADKSIFVLLGLCTQLFLAVLWEKKIVNHGGKLSPEIAYGWCQKPFLPFLPKKSQKKCSETISQISEPTFKK